MNMLIEFSNYKNIRSAADVLLIYPYKKIKKNQPQLLTDISNTLINDFLIKKKPQNKI